jgi:hypothetical protein
MSNSAGPIDASQVTIAPPAAAPAAPAKHEGFFSGLLHKGAALLEKAAVALEPEIEAAEKAIAPAVEAAATAELGIVGGAVAAAATQAIENEGNQLVKDLGQPVPAAAPTKQP